MLQGVGEPKMYSKVKKKKNEKKRKKKKMLCCPQVEFLNI